MRKVNIMTWNTGITEWVKSNDNNERYKRMVDFIKSYLANDNSIVFLQQIPYQYLDYESKEWSLNPLFESFQDDFSEYEIKCNKTYNKGHIVMITVAISSKDSMDSASEKTYPNKIPTSREYAVTFNKLTILGIHARSGDENKAYLESLNGQADIILGDFNAGNYPMSENKLVFKNILEKHVCICNMPTRIDPKSKRRTCIDHVFVRDNIVAICSNLIVHEDIVLSDHFPITFEIDII